MDVDKGPIGSSLAESTRDPYRGQTLLLVVGCPRSGTTWLQRLLASHPQIRTGQESHIFQYVAPLLQRWEENLDAHRDRGGAGLACYLTEDAYLHAVQTFLEALLEPLIAPLAPNELFLEKTPAHGRYLKEVVAFLPEVRIIHISRDPRDVVASMLAASRSWGAGWAPRDPAAAARKWRQHVTAFEASRRYLAAGQLHELSYEDLHRDTAGELRRCLDFIGLAWSDDELLAAVAANTPKAAREHGGTAIPLGGEVRQRTGHTTVKEPEGFVRRAQVGSWRQDLSLREKLVVWRMLHQAMAAQGYHWPAPYRLLRSLVSTHGRIRRFLRQARA